MCGIAGIVGMDGQHAGTLVNRMLDSLRHRGPDGSGIEKFDACVLGHVRLSIVDLESGAQPMNCVLSRRSIVFNGEIYGYQDLKCRTDYPYRTTSDTEVLLALHEHFGVETPAHHGGMFAYAIWDEAERTLFAARDRYGEKPFYYAFGRGGEFVFCSEIKGILTTGLVTPVLDMDSVRHYFRYLYVNPFRTIYANIHVLPPAHRLVYHLGEHTVKIEKYWQLPDSQVKISLADAVAEFRRLFEKAVAEQLVADVPVGAFLSGGLDSSTVVGVAAEMKRGLRTFSFGFEDFKSELPYAAQLAARYGTVHEELTAQNRDIAELLIVMDEIYDEPLADSSNIPTYLITHMAANYLKVILSGDGADELMGGYNWWYRPLLKRKLVSLIGVRLASFVEGPARFRKYYSAKPVYFHNEDLKALGLSADGVGYEDLTGRKPVGDITDALAMDAANYMPGDILVKTDRAAMANSLELRAPFLDVDLSSFVLTLPESLKITSRSDKIILRESYAEKWTDEIRARDKQGFGAPVPLWLKRESVVALKKSYLNNRSRKVFELLDFDAVQRYAAENSQKTWSLLVFSIWFENRNVLLEGNS